MKKNLVILIVIYLGLVNLYGQQKECFTAEVGASNYQYIGSEQYSNNFSYGFSFIISKYFNNIKLSTGGRYINKSIDELGDDFYSIEKYEHQIRYLSFPFIGSYVFEAKKKIIPSLQTGLCFHKILDHTIKSFYTDGENQTFEGNEENRQLGVSLILGSTISRQINSQFAINLSAYFDYKLIPDYQNQRPTFFNLPEDRFSIGISLGIEYFFKTSDKYYD
jgi:hypothetical protein